MKRTGLICVWIWIAILADSPRTSGQEPAKASLEGTVLRLGTSEAISGVRVELIPESLLRSLNSPSAGGALTAILPADQLNHGPDPIPGVLTDKQGLFSFKNIDPGSYRLTFTRNGYVRQELGPSTVAGQGVAIVLTAGQAMRGISVELTPTGSISGTIRDPAGKPLTGAQVQLMHYSYDSSGQKTAQVSFYARSNDRGEYRLSYLTPGKYYLSAGRSTESNSPFRGASEAAEFGGGVNELAELFTTKYYPGNVDSAKASTLEIRPGAELTAVDLTLDRQRVYSIRGRIVDSTTGNPPAAANLFLTAQLPAGGFQPYGRAGEFTRNIYNASSGTFELRNLAPGVYGIVADVQGMNLHAFVPVRVEESDVEGAVVTLTPYSSISGKLRVEGQELSSVPGIGSSFRMGLPTSWNGSPIVITNVFHLPVSVQGDGSLKVDNVRPIEYRLAVSGLAPGFYVKQARLGGVDLLSQPLRNIVSDIGGLDVVLASDSGNLDGSVVGAGRQPIAGSQVALIPEALRERTDMYKSAISDSAGHFTITGIPPGDYKIYAWESIEPNAWFDPAVLKEFEPSATPVRVAPNSRQSISLSLKR